jgi:hypothetical protein
LLLQLDFLSFSSMDNLFSSSSPDQTDHEGGAVKDAGSASILSSATSSGVSSSANIGVDIAVGGNAASFSHSSSADNISTITSVPANEGAIASGGVSSTASPLFVQSSMLGVPAAGHVVNTISARENNHAPVQSVTCGAVLTGFSFPNPFSANSAIPPVSGVGVAQTSAMSASTPHSASSPISQPIVPALQLLSGGSTSSNTVNFATISAEQLVHKLRQKIPALEVEAWKALDFDGPTILELSNPALLPGQLTEYFGYSGLLRDRVASAIKLLIRDDESVVIDIRKLWGFTASVVSPADSSILGSTTINPIVIRSSTPPVNVIDVSSGSHQGQTPCVRGGGVTFSDNYVTPMQPLTLFSVTDANSSAQRQTDGASHSFLSEFSSTNNYSLDHSVIPATPAALVTPGAGSIAAAAGAATAVNALGAINITLHQPTLQKYNWMILENLDIRATFYQWLKKNRREKIICDAANQRSLASLVSDTVRQDVMRIYNTERDLFHSTTPIYSYAYVTDELLLKILFYRHGPLNARDAVSRLKEQKFSFDDSTTFQERFAPKLRRHTTEFRQSLLDMQYTAHLWPQSNNMLSHSVIVDAFLSCFEIEDDIVGPDGKSKVPKCSSMQPLRDMIRENKHLKLDAIIDIVTKRFEQIDAHVRSDSLLKHNVQPWRTQGKFNARKRKYEQVSFSEGDNPKHKKQTSSEGNPRCNNCGSKGHICGEKTCYFWGHPKAKGKDGKWPDGTPSLRLEDEEMAEWRGQRQDIFYSYPENAHKKNKNKTAKGGNSKGKPKGISKK